jgi:hypothetical protein
MLMQASLMLLGSSLDLFVDRSIFQILVDVLILFTPRGIDNAPQYFVLKCLNHLYVTFLGATPKLRTRYLCVFFYLWLTYSLCNGIGQWISMNGEGRERGNKLSGN